MWSSVVSTWRTCSEWARLAEYFWQSFHRRAKDMRLRPLERTDLSKKERQLNQSWSSSKSYSPLITLFCATWITFSWRPSVCTSVWISFAEDQLNGCLKSRRSSQRKESNFMQCRWSLHLTYFTRTTLCIEISSLTTWWLTRRVTSKWSTSALLESWLKTNLPIHSVERLLTCHPRSFKVRITASRPNGGQWASLYSKCLQDTPHLTPKICQPCMIIS